MATVKDIPAPAVPNAKAILALAVDRDGSDNRANDLLQKMRGEEPELESVPKSAAE